MRLSVWDAFSVTSMVCVDGLSPNFFCGASWDTDELVGFLGQKIKVQGHSMTKYAKKIQFSWFGSTIYLRYT